MLETIFIGSGRSTDLEVGVGEDVGRGVEVLELLERRHDLRPHDAALLVDKLDGGLAAVVGHAIADLIRISWAI